jgi:hypothetical protein
VFGKQNNTAINLSAIAAGTSTDGFVINGESADEDSPLITKPPVPAAMADDTDITLSGNITATNKVIGTVADLEYTYTRS